MTDFGIDIPINITKAAFIANLWTTFDYTAYGRAYRNEKEEGLIPEHHVDGEKSYEDVLLDDKLDALSFFDITPGDVQLGGMKASVDIYFAVNLKKLFSTVTERATERAINDAIVVLRRSAFRILGIDRGLHSWDVWNGVKPGDNMQSFFLFKFETEVFYQYTTDC